MTNFTSHPCPACEYRDGVLVRQCEQCRQAMSPPAAGGRLHIPTLQAAARAVCQKCHEGLPICYYGGIIEHVILPDGCRVTCDAVPIQMLIEKEQEARHDHR